MSPGKRMLRITAAVWLACFALMSHGGATAQTRVTIGYASTAMSLITAPWLAAYELGFFEEQGIDLQWMILNGGVNAVQQTMTKSIDLTYPSANELLMIGKQQGREPLPIRFFYLGFPQNIWQIAVLESSSIHSVAELRGKRLGIFGNQAAYLPQFRSIARHAGLDPEKDIQLRVVGVGAGALQALRAGHVDASMQGEVQHAAFENLGAELRRLPFPPLMQRLHGPGFLTHEDNLSDPKRRDVMVRVARAMAMGTLFCETSPKACVELAWRAVPTLKPQGDDRRALQDAVHVMEAILGDMRLRPEQNGQYGRYLNDSWNAYRELLTETGELNAPVDVPSLFTNDLIEAANEFDHDRVVALARRGS
jgi:NitT/TauT family transport system substrate-binding protein